MAGKALFSIQLAMDMDIMQAIDLNLRAIRKFDVGTLPVPEFTSNENAGIENPGSREDTRL